MKDARRVRATVRISFDANAPEETVRQAEQLLEADPFSNVILDFDGIERLDVPCLRALDRVSLARGRVQIDHIAPEPYKAMHLAGLAARWHRA